MNFNEESAQNTSYFKILNQSYMQKQLFSKRFIGSHVGLYSKAQTSEEFCQTSYD